MHTYSVLNQFSRSSQIPKKFQIILLGLVPHAAVNASFVWVARGVA